MDPLIVVCVVFIGFFLVFTLVLGAVHPRTGRQIVGRSLRDEEVQAQIEAEDIDQMIEARNDIRRRRGLPTIGDDLEAEARRKPE